jgi:hypothetical protein
VANGLVVGAELLSNDVAKGRRAEQEKVRVEVLKSSGEFTEMVLAQIALVLVRSIDTKAVPGEKIDWPDVEKSLGLFFRGPVQLLQRKYSPLEFTPDGREINRWITPEGEISPGAYPALIRLAIKGCDIFLSAKNKRAARTLGPDFKPEYLTSRGSEIDSFMLSLSGEQRIRFLEIRDDALYFAKGRKILESEISKGR